MSDHERHPRPGTLSLIQRQAGNHCACCGHPGIVASLGRPSLMMPAVCVCEHCLRVALRMLTPDVTLYPGALTVPLLPDELATLQERASAHGEGIADFARGLLLHQPTAAERAARSGGITIAERDLATARAELRALREALDSEDGRAALAWAEGRATDG